MKILLIGNRFFGYTDRVGSYLSNNNEVDVLYIYKPTFKDRILRKLGRISKAYYNYYYSLANGLSKDYDRILVFGGGAPLFFIKQIKEKYPDKKIIIYLSADMASYKFTDEYLEFFDKKYTYSLNESRKFGFEYRPWFYTNVQNLSKSIDISFIGSLHSSRLKILTNFESYNTLKRYFYIFTDRITFLRNAFEWHDLRKYIHYSGLPYDEYIQILAQSVASLDIPDSSQNNITTRPIEALATKTKIITTNNLVVNYDFYCPDNILILNDNTSLQQITNWLNKPYHEIDINILSNYSVETWCNEVLK